MNRHTAELKSKFGIDVGIDNLSLPNMYWIPKKHKVPSKTRFIVAASLCSMKPLAKSLTSIFKLFYRQIEKYSEIDRFFSGVKTFWVIQDKKPVVNTIRNLNKRKQAKSIMTFDFSTLYTKIPHDKLKDVLHELTDFCFRGCTKSKILVNEYGAIESVVAVDQYGNNIEGKKTSDFPYTSDTDNKVDTEKLWKNIGLIIAIIGGLALIWGLGTAFSYVMNSDTKSGVLGRAFKNRRLNTQL